MKNITDWSKIVAEKDAALSEKDARIVELEALVKFYEGQFRLAKHRQFGISSEKSEYDGRSNEQLNLFNEAEATADANITEPALTEISRHFRKRKRLINDRLPENLPIETVEHDLPANEQICPACDGDLHAMGREKRRELVIIPAKVLIREHIRKVYACRDCEKDEFGVPIVKSPIDNPVIKGSFASPEAIAHIMYQKFVMASPLYRQEQDWNRQGIMLSRQTMSNWIIRATEDWLEPIYYALRELMLFNYTELHADETTLQVLREPGKAAQSKSYMWLYRTSGYMGDRYNRYNAAPSQNAAGQNMTNQNAQYAVSQNTPRTTHPIVLYEYQPGRKAKYPAEFLKGYEGFVHADGYEVYHGLSPNIIIVGCWAHARRKFDEALKSLPESDRGDSNALIGKRYCDKLFDLERQFADMTPDERYQKRQELSKPIMDAFFAWLGTLRILPKAPVGVAAQYALKQRQYLERYLTNGRLEISNNRAERSIKPFVIGRKNFLFANTPRGAKASAIIYSIIETAKESGLNPFTYLTYIFQNAPNWDIRNDMNALQNLLPAFVPDEVRAVIVSSDN